MKKFLSLVLALVMTMSLVTISAGAKDFTDSDEITYTEAVDVMSTMGIIDGYDGGSFQPTGTLTRGAAAKIIACMMLGKTTAEALGNSAAPFKDVPVGSTFAGYIAYCSEAGIIDGYADGTFRPSAKLTGFAFLKMLLTALGYDSDVEGYTGTNWTVNVSSRAIEIGLTAGNDEFVGTELATREEACLYAVNTLKATLVEYASKGTNVTVNGATVAIGASKPVYVTSNIYSAATSIDNTRDNATGDYTVEFAENYQPKLKLNRDLDVFGRPAYTWNWDSKDIGTYVDYSQLVLEATAAVKFNEVYEVLGSTVLKGSDLAVYFDGVKSNAIVKNDIARTNKVTMDGTGNGVLTQVFYDGNDEITIVEINTYLAKATSDYNEKTDKLNLTVYGYNKTTRKLDSSVDAPYTGITSESIAAAADCESDDFLLVTIADGVLQTIDFAESESDVAMTSFVKDKSVGNATTTYNFAKSLRYDPAILQNWDANNMANETYNVYLDEYGYLVGIELYSAAKNYVFITGYDISTSAIAASTVKATAIFTDGSKQTIDVNAEKGVGATWTTKNSVLNTWYTYSVNSAGVYTLTDNATWVHDTEHDIKSAYVGLHQTTPAGRYYYGNLETNYILVDKDTGLKTLDSKRAIYKIENVISGMRNVNIDATTAGNSCGSYAVVNSKGYIIAAVVVGDNLGLSQNYAYVTTGNPKVENIRSDSEGYWYWDFEVITKDDGITTKTVKGEFGTLTSIIASGAEGLYTFTYDADGYVVDADPVTPDITTPDAIVPGTTSDMRYTTTYQLQTDGETINAVNAGTYMRGFALAAGYKIYTVETLNGTVTAQDWGNDAIAAVSSLALNDAVTTKDVYALFNSNGEATTVVIVIGTNFNGNQGGNWGSSGNVTALGGTYTANATPGLPGTLTVNLTGAAATDTNVVTLSMIVAGVTTPMGSYEITGPADTITISLASGAYLLTCGNVTGSFTVA